MTTERQRHAVSAFESREHAEQALGGLRDAGFRDEDVGWAMRHGDAPEGVENKANDAAGGAVTGALTGGALGALGAAAAMALIPGIGPFIGGGILATVLTGAGAGAAAGGLLGALTGLGVDEEEAKYYDEEFRAGRPVMTVNAGDRHDEAREIFRRHGGYDYETRRGATGGTISSGTGGTTTATTERTVITTDRDDDTKRTNH